jgi:hypothetical protein
LLHLVEHAIKVQGNRRGNPFQTAVVEVGDLLIPFEPADRLTDNGPEKVSLEALNRVLVAHCS